MAKIARKWKLDLSKAQVKVRMPRTGYFTKAWNAITEFNWWSYDSVTKNISIADLIATQEYVRLNGLVSCDPTLPILVVKYRGKFYIRDGHHRTTRARALGKKTVLAEVVEL